MTEVEEVGSLVASDQQGGAGRGSGVQKAS